MKPSPAEGRLAAAAGTPSGWIVPSGLSEFRRAIAGAENANSFNEWRNHRFTKLLYLALQDAILHPGHAIDTDSIPAQYGVTQGLAFAAQLISDPTVLFPNAFGPGMENVTPKGRIPSESFSQPPDGGGQ